MRHRIVGNRLHASPGREADEVRAGLIVSRATQVVSCASLRAHVYLSSRQNPPPLEPPEASPQPVPTSVRQEAALIPPGTKDTLAGVAEQYWYVLPLPLAGIFTGQVGRPDSIEGGGEPDTDAYEGGYQCESHPGSEASAEEEEEEEEDGQELLADEVGQEASGTGSGHIDQTLESISALASSVTLLQVQADREQRLPQQRTRHAAPLRRALTQACQVGTAGTRKQVATTFPPAQAPTFPTAPT